jgi:O-antigen/teichoic acid export membrane protein
LAFSAGADPVQLPIGASLATIPRGEGRLEAKVSILQRASPLMLARLLILTVTFATPLVLARVLIPASYGTFKLAWLWCTTLGHILPMGLTPSLVYFVPRNPQRRHHFIAHALLVTTTLGLIAGALLYAFGARIALAMHQRELAAQMHWVALFSALFLSGSTMDQIPFSQGRIKFSAALRFGSEGAQAIGIISGALLTRSLTGAMAGIVVGTGFRAIACWWMVLREHGLHISREDLRRQLVYAVPFGVAFGIIYLQQQFHQYYVAASVSAAIFAIYAVGCFQLPIVDMLYTPVSEVLQLGIAEYDRDGDRAGPARLMREAVAKLAFVFIPTMALLYVCGPTLLTFLFTERYRDSAAIFRLVIFFIPLMALPLDGVMRARAQNSFVLGMSIVKLALTVPLVIGGFHLFGLRGAMGGYLMAETVTRTIVLLRAAALLGGLRAALPWRTLAFQSLSAAAAAPVGAIVLHVTHGPAIVRLFACGIATAVVYLAVLRFSGELPPVREWIRRKRPVPEPRPSLAA